MAEDEFRNALTDLVDDFIDTETDAAKAIDALQDQIDRIERMREKRAD